MIRISLRGRTVIVTGAYQGIGRAIAEALAEAGADLVLVDSNPLIGETAAAIARQFSILAAARQCDITEFRALENELRDIERIDVLIGNAGIQPITPIAEAGAEAGATIARVMEVNVMGNFNLLRICLPRMGTGGRVLLTASIWGKIGVPDYAAYCASKHAVIGMVRALAPELGPRGISINAVCPGLVETPGVRDESILEAEYYGTTLKALFDTAVSLQSIRRLMEPKDVAGTYLFLASHLSESITGQAITVDCGGVTA
jgi:3-hydroxybutyrate dehydrogenase